MGPLPRSKEGFNHLLMVVDHRSHWLEAFPLESTSTETIADTFIGGWVSLFGVPDHITLDCGPQFCSALKAQLSQHLGTLHHLTTAYHPQANERVERTHRQLKDFLRACTAGRLQLAVSPPMCALRLQGRPLLSVAPLTPPPGGGGSVDALHKARSASRKKYPY